MSGLEVIGLLLNLYPLMVDGLKVYKNLRSGLLIDSLIQDLQQEKIIYMEFVDAILQPIISNSRELAELTDINSTTVGKWRDTGLQELLESHLRPEKTRLILKKLNHMHDLLMSLQKDIKYSLEGPSSRIAKFGSVFNTLRHGRKDSTFREKLAGLHAGNESLQRLLQDRQLPAQRTLASRSVSQLRHDEQTVEIYDVIHDGYKCLCRGPHLTKLALPSLSTYLETAYGPGYASKRPLQLVFSLEDEPTNDEEMNVITPVVTKDSLKLSPTTSLETLSLSETIESSHLGIRGWSTALSDTTLTNSLTRTSTMRSCAVTISEAESDHEEPIQDLCFALKFAPSAESQHIEDLGILPSKKRRKFDLKRNHKSELASCSAKSFEELFENSDGKVSRESLITLALRLSFAVLQLHSTRWISHKWSWDDFCLSAISDRKEEAYLFIIHHFYSSLRQHNEEELDVKSNSDLLTVFIGEPILTRLGFALVEIALGRRLVDLRVEADRQISDTAMCNFATACRLLDSGQLRFMGEKYEDVVEACLRHQYRFDFQVRCLNSSAPTFFKEADQVILAPLHSYWIKSYGGRARQSVY